MLVNPITFSFGLDTAVQSLRRSTPYSGAIRAHDNALDVATRQANGGPRVDPRQADGLGYRQASNLQATVKAFEGAKQNIVFGQKAIADAREAVKTVREHLASIRDKVIEYQDKTVGTEEKRQIANDIITLQARVEGTITRAQTQGVNLLTSSIKKVIDSTPAQLAATTRTTYDVDLNGDGTFDVSFDGSSSNTLTLTPGGESGTTGGVLASSTQSALLALSTDGQNGSDVNLNLQSALNAYGNGDQTSRTTTVAFQAPGQGGSGSGDNDDDDRHRNEIGRGHDDQFRTRNGNGYGYGHSDGDDDDGGGNNTIATGSFTATGSLSLSSTGSATNPTGATSIAANGSALAVDFNGDGVNDLTINSTTTNTLNSAVTSGNDTAVFSGTGTTQTNTSLVYTSTFGGGGGGEDDDNDHDNGGGDHDRDDDHRVNGQGNGYAYGHGRDGGGSGGSGGTTVTTALNVATTSTANFDGTGGTSGTQSGTATNTFNIDRNGDGTSDFAVRVTTTTTYDYSGFGTRTVASTAEGGLPVFGEAAGVTDVPGVEFSAAAIGSSDINLTSGLNSALTTVEKALKKSDLTDKYLDFSAQRLKAQDEQINKTIEAAKGGVETIFKADEEKAKAFVSAAEQRQETAKKAISEGQNQAKTFSGLLINVQADATVRKDELQRSQPLAARVSQAYGQVSTGLTLPPIVALNYPIAAASTESTTQVKDAQPTFPYALPGIDAIA